MDEFCPLITVGVVALNREWIIDKMLASLQSQTYPHSRIFVILVDGGSTDKTVEIAKRILEKADFKGYEIIVKKCTIPEGRNICIEKMRGEMLLFWDSDIIMEPNAIWKFVRTMEKEKAQLVSTRAIFVYINSINELETKIKSAAEHKRGDFLYEVPGVGMGHTLISKKVFQVLNFDPDLTILEDFDFSVRARKHGFKLLINEGIVVFDVNMMKKGYSDIHIDMPLKDALRGIRKKAYAQVMANNFKITFKGMLNFFFQNKRYIFYLGHIPAATLSLYGIFSVNIHAAIVFPLYFLSFTIWQIKRRGLDRGIKAAIRSIFVGVPTVVYLLYYFIRCAVAKSKG